MAFEPFQFTPYTNYSGITSGLNALGEGLGGLLTGISDRNALSDFNGDLGAAAERLMRMGRIDEAIKLYQADALASYRNGMLGVAQQKVDISPAAQAQKWLDDNMPGTQAPPAAPQPTPSPDFGMSPAESTPMELGPSDSTQLATPAPIPAGPNGPTGAYGSSYATPSGMDPRLVNAPKSVQDVLAPAQAMTQLNKEAELKVKRQEEEPTDWGLVQSADENFANMERNISQLITPEGKPTPALRAISGNYNVRGRDTGIPNAPLYNLTQQARDAHATLQTSVVEVGLNTLAQMRAMSAQGASGMGQLAIQESQWLQQSLNAVGEEQSPEQLARNLKAIVVHSQRLRAALRQKFQMSHGKPFTGISQEAISQTPNETAPAMDMGAEPLPGDKVVPGASTLTTNPNAYNPNTAYAASQDKLSKLMTLVASGKVSRQAAAAAMKRDQYPDEIIQRVLGGQ